MELYEAITTRRSVRSFQQGEITDAIIEKLLRAAMLAPSAANQQPWKFIVVRDRAKLDGITSFHPYCTMITQVSVAIIVVGDTSQTRARWASSTSSPPCWTRSRARSSWPATP